MSYSVTSSDPYLHNSNGYTEPEPEYQESIDKIDAWIQEFSVHAQGHYDTLFTSRPDIKQTSDQIHRELDSVTQK
jgi:hypothetical protein